MEAVSKEPSINLSVLDRISVSAFLPEKGGYVTMIARKDLEDKVRLTQEELKSAGVVEPTPGTMSWTNDFEKVFPLTDLELKMLKEGAKRLNDTESLTPQTLSLYKKITDL